MIQELPYPTLPDGFTELQANVLEVNLGLLWHDVVAEVCDSDYSGRTHGNRRTYDAGCHGPKCSKAAREHGRRRSSARPSEKYQFIDPVVDLWHLLATGRYQEVRAAMVEQVKTA